MGVSTNDLLQDIVVQEYPCHGRFRYNEAALRVRFPDGGRELDLRYRGHSVEDDDLVVVLEDQKGLEVALHYRVLPQIDALLRWASITSTVPGDRRVGRRRRNCMPFRDLELRNVAGHWGAEQQEVVQTVSTKVVLESRRGSRITTTALRRAESRRHWRLAGRVWAAALAFSGNTKVVVEQTQYGQTLLQLGVNDHDLELLLEPGVPFVTPQVVAVHSSQASTR